jgi:hypothetical protein
MPDSIHQEYWRSSGNGEQLRNEKELVHEGEDRREVDAEGGRPLQCSGPFILSHYLSIAYENTDRY